MATGACAAGTSDTTPINTSKDVALMWITHVVIPAHAQAVSTATHDHIRMRIPDDREHRFQSNVNTDSGHVEQRFQDGEHGFRGT